MPDLVVRLVVCGTLPAPFIRAAFARRQRFKSLLPGALADAGIGAREIRLCDLQIERGLTFGLVPGFDELPGFIFIAGLQAGAFAGLRVYAIKGTSPIAATKQAASSSPAFPVRSDFEIGRASCRERV